MYCTQLRKLTLFYQQQQHQRKMINNFMISIKFVTVAIMAFSFFFIQIASFRCNYCNAPYHTHHAYHTKHHNQYQYDDMYHQSHQYTDSLSIVSLPVVHITKRSQLVMRMQEGRATRDINQVKSNRAGRDDLYDNNNDNDDFDGDDDDESNDDSTDGSDDDDDDDYDDRPNPIINTLKKFYDMIFFYGLDESDDINNNSRLISLQNTEGYRRKRNSISKGNPFLTTSEKLGLYLIQSGEIDKLKRKMNSNNNFKNNNDRGGNVKYDDGNEDEEDDDYDLGDIDFKDVVDGNSLTTLPYDPKSLESLEEYITKLRNYIEESSNQLQVIRVTSALLEEENDDNRVENRKDNNLEEEIIVLHRDIQQLVVKINNAKIELITVSAFLDDASSS